MASFLSANNKNVYLPALDKECLEVYISTLINPRRIPYKIHYKDSLSSFPYSFTVHDVVRTVEESLSTVGLFNNKRKEVKWFRIPKSDGFVPIYARFRNPQNKNTRLLLPNFITSRIKKDVIVSNSSIPKEKRKRKKFKKKAKNGNKENTNGNPLAQDKSNLKNAFPKEDSKTSNESTFSILKGNLQNRASGPKGKKTEHASKEAQEFSNIYYKGECIKTFESIKNKKDRNCTGKLSKLNDDNPNIGSKSNKKYLQRMDVNDSKATKRKNVDTELDELATITKSPKLKSIDKSLSQKYYAKVNDNLLRSKEDKKDGNCGGKSSKYKNSGNQGDKTNSFSDDGMEIDKPAPKSPKLKSIDKGLSQMYYAKVNDNLLRSKEDKKDGNCGGKSSKYKNSGNQGDKTNSFSDVGMEIDKPAPKSPKLKSIDKGLSQMYYAKVNDNLLRSQEDKKDRNCGGKSSKYKNSGNQGDKTNSFSDVGMESDKPAPQSPKLKSIDKGLSQMYYAKVNDNLLRSQEDKKDGNCGGKSSKYKDSGYQEGDKTYSFSDVGMEIDKPAPKSPKLKSIDKGLSQMYYAKVNGNLLRSQEDKKDRNCGGKSSKYKGFVNIQISGEKTKSFSDVGLPEVSHSDFRRTSTITENILHSVQAETPINEGLGCGNGIYTGFATASSKKIYVDKAKLIKSKHLMESVEEENNYLSRSKRDENWEELSLKYKGFVNIQNSGEKTKSFLDVGLPKVSHSDFRRTSTITENTLHSVQSETPINEGLGCGNSIYTGFATASSKKIYVDKAKLIESRHLMESAKEENNDLSRSKKDENWKEFSLKYRGFVNIQNSGEKTKSFSDVGTPEVSDKSGSYNTENILHSVQTETPINEALGCGKSIYTGFATASSKKIYVDKAKLIESRHLMESAKEVNDNLSRSKKDGYCGGKSSKYKGFVNIQISGEKTKSFSDVGPLEVSDKTGSYNIENTLHSVQTERPINDALGCGKNNNFTQNVNSLNTRSINASENKLNYSNSAKKGSPSSYKTVSSEEYLIDTQLAKEFEKPMYFDEFECDTRPSSPILSYKMVKISQPGMTSASENTKFIEQLIGIDDNIWKEFEKPFVPESECNMIPSSPILSSKMVKNSQPSVISASENTQLIEHLIGTDDNIRREFEKPFVLESECNMLPSSPILSSKTSQPSKFVFDSHYKKQKINKFEDITFNKDNHNDLFLLSYMNFDDLLRFTFKCERNNISHGELSITSLIELFKTSVNVKIIPNNWLENHTKLILWKLILYEMKFSNNFELICNPRQVMNQLKYRYDRELQNLEKPALRRLYLRTIESSRLIVLNVVKITFDCVHHNIELKLTDGWYCINATVDNMLKRMVVNKKIVVGTKIKTAGAKLINCDLGMEPWEAGAEAVRLKIYGNSTCCARWDMRLGFHNSNAVPVSLSSICVDGGIISKLYALVLRVYPELYIETLPDKSTVTRTQRQEDVYILKCEKDMSQQAINDRVRILETKSLADKAQKQIITEINKIIEETDACIRARNVSKLQKVRIISLSGQTTGVLSIWNNRSCPPAEGSLILASNVVVSSYRDKEFHLSTRRYNIRRIRDIEKRPEIINAMKRRFVPLCELLTQTNTYFDEVDTVGLVSKIDTTTRDLDQIYLTDKNKNTILISVHGGLKTFDIEGIFVVDKIVAVMNLKKSGPLYFEFTNCTVATKCSTNFDNQIDVITKKFCDIDIQSFSSVYKALLNDIDSFGSDSSSNCFSLPMSYNSEM